MEPSESEKTIDSSRAKELDTGALPLLMSNVTLGLPTKPELGHDVTSVSANTWSWEELIGQRRLISTIGIDPSTSETKPVWEFHNTWDNVYKHFFASNIGKMFSLYSWDVKFTLEFRSTFQQVGLCNIVYSNCPWGLETYFFPGNSTFDSIHSFTAQTQLAHRLIPMGEDTNVDVVLSWLSPFQAGTSLKSDVNQKWQNEDPRGAFDDDYHMGILRLYVPYKMMLATGVENTQLTVRIWGSLQNLRYVGYDPRDRYFST